MDITRKLHEKMENFKRELESMNRKEKNSGTEKCTVGWV